MDGLAGVRSLNWLLRRLIEASRPATWERKPRSPAVPLRKSEIANLLGRKHGLRRYLEISSPTTGSQYRNIDRRQYRFCRRLIYRCLGPGSSAEATDIAVPDVAIEGEALARIAAGAPYDLVFVDPWHSYECSLRDIELGWSLLAETGVLVVHDCSPPSLALAGPEFQPGSWCGLTYAAFIDFTLSETGLDFYTVDADYGCAVVRRRKQARAQAAGPSTWTDGWRQTAKDHRQRFAYFDQRRKQLLRLTTTEDFLRLEGLRR
jgi:hypothetical protein